jgi:hypothetical protein
MRDIRQAAGSGFSPRQLGYANIFVGDLERSMRFYVNVCGILHPRRRGGYKAYRSTAIEAPAPTRRKLADLGLCLRSAPRQSSAAAATTGAQREKGNTPLSGREPETDLAVVIGKPGRHIPPERALEHVFGCMIVNDVTARDRQVRRTPEGHTWYELGRGKAFEGSAPMGLRLLRLVMPAVTAFRGDLDRHCAPSATVGVTGRPLGKTARRQLNIWFVFTSCRRATMKPTIRAPAFPPQSDALTPPAMNGVSRSPLLPSRPLRS